MQLEDEHVTLVGIPIRNFNPDVTISSANSWTFGSIANLSILMLKSPVNIQSFLFCIILLMAVLIFPRICSSFCLMPLGRYRHPMVRSFWFLWWGVPCENLPSRVMKRLSQTPSSKNVKSFSIFNLSVRPFSIKKLTLPFLWAVLAFPKNRYPGRAFSTSGSGISWVSFAVGF